MQHTHPNMLRTLFAKSFTIGEALAWFGVFILIGVLGAHFYRAGQLFWVFSLVGIVLFHCSTAHWKTCIVGLALTCGAAEWGATVYSLVALRMQLGVPWMRGALILAVVAAITAVGALFVLLKAQRQYQAAQNDPLPVQVATFLLTFYALYALRTVMPHVLILERMFPMWGGIQIFILAWYAGSIAGRLSDARKNQKTRKTVWLIFSIVFFGQLLLGLAGVSGIALSNTLHVPVPAFILFAPAYRGSMSMMPYLIVAATLLVGSAWCSMLCYFGALEANASSGKIIRKAPPFLRAMMRYGRAGVLIGGITIAVLLRYAGAPIPLVLSVVALFAVLSLFIMLFVARKYTGMVHCTSFCPIGLIVTWLAKLSPWRMRIDPERCDNCGACEKTCAYRALDAESRALGVAGQRCSLCRDCVSVCPHKAIYIKNVFCSKNMSAKLFTILLVTLHVVFLAAARPL